MGNPLCDVFIAKASVFINAMSPTNHNSLEKEVKCGAKI